MGAVRNALQAPPFPMRLRPLLPPPRLFRKLDALRFPLGHFPPLLRGVAARGKWRVSFVWVLARSPLPPPFVRWVERGGWGARGLWLLWARAIWLLPPSRGRE